MIQKKTIARHAIVFCFNLLYYNSLLVKVKGKISLNLYTLKSSGVPSITSKSASQNSAIT